MATEHANDMVTVEETTSSTLKALFEKKQDTYRLLVEKDYLHHHDIVKEIKRYMSKNMDKETVSVLDLGCGDCSISAACFDPYAIVPHNDRLPIVNRFVGVDLAERPLEVASKSNLFSENTEIVLHRAEFFEYLDSNDERFDIVISSFAVHHLETSKKSDLFKKIFSSLNPDGIFFLADSVNAVAGRSIDDFKKEIKTFFLETGFNELNLEQRHELWGHVSTYDLPEDFPTIAKLFYKNGFKDVKCLYKDDFYIALWVGGV